MQPSQHAPLDAGSHNPNGLGLQVGQKPKQKAQTMPNARSQDKQALYSRTLQENSARALLCINRVRLIHYHCHHQSTPLDTQYTSSTNDLCTDQAIATSVIHTAVVNVTARQELLSHFTNLEHGEDEKFVVANLPKAIGLLHQELYLLPCPQLGWPSSKLYIYIYIYICI